MSGLYMSMGVRRSKTKLYSSEINTSCMLSQQHKSCGRNNQNFVTVYPTTLLISDTTVSPYQID